ncbi:MAG: DNA adenine methylase [Chloroflexi bacterium]|nr:DNA adenine methylase [Chloroflexota bacterium]
MTIDAVATKPINSPFKWVGGKSRLRQTIVKMMPECDCYVEVFAGAAWVLFGKRPSHVEILNDLDGEVVNFFKVIKNKPNEFLESFELDLVSREEFERLRSITAESLAEWTDIQRAHRFYYLVMAAWGGEFHSPRFQTSVSDGGHGNRLIGALKHLRERIDPVHKRLQTVIIEHLDWRACIERYDRSYEDNRVVMYLDPPYPLNPCNYRLNMRARKQHAELAKVLRDVKCRFILSSYDLLDMKELYKDFFVTPVSFTAGMPAGKKGKKQRTKNQEIIVTNYDPIPEKVGDAPLLPVAFSTLTTSDNDLI